MVVPTRTTQADQDRSITAIGRVALIAKPGGAHTGVGRYVRMLDRGLRAAGLDTARSAPALPPLRGIGDPLLRRLGIDLSAFLTNYPIWPQRTEAEITHLTSQNLASQLLFCRPRGRILVTVHDIIPYMLRHNARLGAYRTAAERLFDRLAMAGLKRADMLIADSYYTSRCLTEQLSIAPERIAVVYLGIDHQQFQPLPVPASIRERYALPAGPRYLIYVGSEDPRKNLETLIRALLELRRDYGDVELIKVGRAHFESERRHLINLSSTLGIRSALHLLDDLPEHDLPLLYNLADICVMPSLYEGFGFPVAEAMACGTPVVCMNAASLPEVAGVAGRLVQPGAEMARDLAASIGQILREPQLARDMRAAGMTQAARFQWSQTARQTIAVYQSLHKQVQL